MKKTLFTNVTEGTNSKSVAISLNCTSYKMGVVKVEFNSKSRKCLILST